MVHPGKLGEVLNPVPLFKKKKLFPTSAQGATEGGLSCYFSQYHYELLGSSRFNVFQPLWCFLTDTHTVSSHLSWWEPLQIAPLLLIFSQGVSLAWLPLRCDKGFQAPSYTFSAPAQGLLALFNEKSCLETKVLVQRRFVVILLAIMLVIMLLTAFLVGNALLF